MEQSSCDDEETEKEDLDEETTDNNLLPSLDGFDLLGAHETTATGLHKKREDIAGDEKPGHPASADEEIVVSLDELDNTTQLHVNGSSEQGRCDERKHALNDIWNQRPFEICLACVDCSGCIPSTFDCDSLVDESSESFNGFQPTDASEEEGDEEPSRGSKHLIAMQCAGQEEKDDEEDCGRLRRMVSVQIEFPILEIVCSWNEKIEKNLALDDIENHDGAVLGFK